MTPESANNELAGALRGLAIGRIVLGIASLAAPNLLAKAGRVPAAPELTYMTRIFGIRAMALGLGYLTSAASERFRWQRLALMVDITDTTHGALHLVRGDLPRATVAAMVALTGGYMSVGATRLIKDLTAA
ncbi:Aspartate carbamoyl transferase [Mycobacteroides abscessus subsp. massiliense]|uniref:Aspartate carbamoyl transferase n=1 Tax=Mycobacteroides abscessus TaxID=36809 RepID=A0A0U0ZPA1_9MYCO|nr:Aspartate carbamoyl transferase [Mycobacteroides abscessus]SKQ54216.1 Aspartate carbamoyl transferase [Mycobacteroides abscessus subsp. massiliense]SKU72710.1 Aspartate carbamoyl transferase [Mycobacteroides abscessus subsp. massiliense]SKU90018.1 Aspartate carbamoyl transferase [Mycobacteroides abscessus subsp. massiliense]SKU96221.1 Aspartate carbamoyl transferase [Mycobacteroides abscessus subsp. massiliense]